MRNGTAKIFFRSTEDLESQNLKKLTKFHNHAQLSANKPNPLCGFYPLFGCQKQERIQQAENKLVLAIFRSKKWEFINYNLEAL